MTRTLVTIEESPQGRILTAPRGWISLASSTAYSLFLIAMILVIEATAATPTDPDFAWLLLVIVGVCLGWGTYRFRTAHSEASYVLWPNTGTTLLAIARKGATFFILFAGMRLLFDHKFDPSSIPLALMMGSLNGWYRRDLRPNTLSGFE